MIGLSTHVKTLEKDILKLTLPIIAEQTFIMLMGAVNTVMAGRLGKEAISAIGMIDSINNMVIAFFSALAIGGTVVVAQNTGRKNTDRTNKAALNAIFSGLAIALIITVLLSIFKNPILRGIFHTADPLVIENAMIYFNITILSYPFIAVTSIAFGILRGSGDMKTPLKITIVMNLVNIVLSYVLIYGLVMGNSHFNVKIPGYGIKGAAFGIAIARAAGLVLIMFALLKNFLKINIGLLKGFRFDPVMLKEIFQLGIPTSIESLMFNGGKLITQVMIVSIGTATIAANAVAGSVFGLLNITGSALSIVAVTVVGQYIGRKDVKMATETLKFLIRAGMVSLLFLCTLVYPFVNVLASLYTKDAEVIKIAAMLMKSSVFAMPVLWSHSFILPSGLKGGGDVKYTLLVSVLGMWLCRLTLGYVLALPLGMGVLGIWIAMYGDWLVRAILFYLRFKSGKWVRDYTPEKIINVV